jgi:hypothetical protein
MHIWAGMSEFEFDPGHSVCWNADANHGPARSPVPRSAASHARFATFPDLLVENPKAEIAPLAAQEKT